MARGQAEEILYGAAPSLREGRLRAADSQAFEALKRAEIASVQTDPRSVIVDTILETGGDARVDWNKLVERDDAIMNKFQETGIIAVWYRQKDLRHQIQMMLTTRADDLGIDADRLSFADWQHQDLYCMGMRICSENE